MHGFYHSRQSVCTVSKICCSACWPMHGEQVQLLCMISSCNLAHILHTHVFYHFRQGDCIVSKICCSACWLKLGDQVQLLCMISKKIRVTIFITGVNGYEPFDPDPLIKVSAIIFPLLFLFINWTA